MRTIRCPAYFLVFIIFLFVPAKSAFAGWAKENSPAPGKSLYGIWGSAAGDVFAVGEEGTIIHYDGKSWSLMESGTAQKLYGVWGSGKNDVFAVGAGGAIIHYDGASWRAMESQTKVALNGGIWGSAANDVFAAGEDGTILHYDGDSWIPADSGTEVSLGGGIWGSSGSDVFAAGAALLHYDGIAWSSMPAVNEKFLSGVWGSGKNDVFAVGSGGAIIHYDGASWSLMSSGTTGWLDGVWGSSGTDVFAGGYDGKSGVILHYDGSAWNSMNSNTVYSLYGVWGTSSDNVFIAGERATLLHYDGTPSPEEVCPAQLALGREHPALDKLRCLRDSIASQHAGAEQYVALYYKHSREAASILAAHPGLLAFFRELLFELPGIAETSDEPIHIPDGNAYAQKVSMFMMDMAQHASPALRKDLQRAEGAFRYFTK